MALLFDWDEHNRKHIARHRVRVDEAEEVVLNDPIDLTVETEGGEERIVQVGETAKGRVLVVVTTWCGEKLRVITAYPAPRRLRKLYFEASAELS